MNRALQILLFGGQFSPLRLFRAGEQGAWYDPSDFSTMFQDSAGTTPVTAVGQPVGLILDKRLGAVRGANAAPATTSTTGWTSQGGTPLLSSDGTSISIENGSAAESYAQIDGFAATTGQWYEVTATVDSYSGGASGSFVCGTFRIALGGPGAIRIIFQAPSAAVVLFGTSSNTTGAKTVFRNASLRTLAGNHRTQATAASRPTLSARYNQFTNTEQLNAAPWLDASTSIVATGITAPDGTSSAFTLNIGAGGVHYQGLTGVAANNFYTHYFWARKSATGAASAIRFYSDNAVAASTGSSTKHILTTAWQPFIGSAVLSNSSSSNVGLGSRLADTSNDPDCVGNVDIWRPDLRTSADADLNIPAYQRITTASDYDTAGFYPYLSYDGVDDSMATGSVDFSATNKITEFYGFTSSADATQMFCELSADASATNGAFNFYIDTATPRYNFALRGTVAQEVNSTAKAGTPDTCVISASRDLSLATPATRTTARRNGVALTFSQIAGPTTGGSNFSNNPIYFGRRNGASLPFNGREYCTIIRGAATSDSQIARVERFVAARMGVALA